MSVRAYRVNKIEYREEPTFNLWNDDKTYSIVEPYLNEGGEHFEVSVDDIERWINEDEVSEPAKEQFKKDLDWAKKHNKDFILYHCW